MSHLKSKYVGSELVLFKKNGTAEHGSGLNHSNFRQNLEFCRIPIGIRNIACKVVAEWLIDVYENIPEMIGMNAWKKEGYKWF